MSVSLRECACVCVRECVCVHGCVGVRVRWTWKEGRGRDLPHSQKFPSEFELSVRRSDVNCDMYDVSVTFVSG